MTEQLTATRVPCDMTTDGIPRVLYKLSHPTTSMEMRGAEFSYVVISFGRAGDTCAFPADAKGGIQDMYGFGFGMGPNRWLVDSELDMYIAACIAKHKVDGGKGLAVAQDFGWE